MSLNIYNPTTQQLTEVAGLDVKDSLEKVATLPTPTADYLNQVYILVGTQEGYHVGSIYQCRYINSAYTWVEITGSVVGKADKAPNATNNHLAKLTADGNLADSGIAVGDLGTAINKNWTDLVRPNSHDLVESNAVYSAITNAISSIYTPHGDITCAELVPALLIDENIGNVYTVTDSGTTTAYFMQGAGKTINTGDSVSIIKAGATEILFNLMGNVLDLTDYQKKNLTTAIEIGGTIQTTVEGALGGLNTKETDDIKDVYEVMGQNGAKNLIPFPYTDGFSKTMNGITYVVNSDGSVTVNGTATDTSHFSLCQPQLDLEDGTYILTGDMDEEVSYNKIAILFNENDASGASHWNYGKNAPCEFTQNGWKVSELRIRVTSGATVNNQTFYPMIRLASDFDDTYVPYAMTNKQLTDNKVGWKSNGIIGAKNLLPFNLTAIKAVNTGGTWSGNTYTSGSSVFTFNDDGTITFTGTAGTGYSITFPSFTLPKGNYILSGCPSDGSVNKWYMQSYGNVDYTSGSAILDTGNGFTFTLTATNTLSFAIFVKNGYDGSTLTFKPMIRLASDTDTTYQPYAMTNQQLTKHIDVATLPVSTITSSVGTVQTANVNLVKSGNILTYKISISGLTIPANTWTSIGRFDGLASINNFLATANANDTTFGIASIEKKSGYIDIKVKFTTAITNGFVLVYGQLVLES